MNLQFDNLNELEQFLMFSAHIGRAFMPAPPAGEPGMDPQEPVLQTDSSGVVTAVVGAPEIDTLEKATETITQITFDPPITVLDTAATAEAAKSKRTRRTKAEIEAERVQAELAAEDRAAAENNPLTPGVAGPATSPNPPGANPFAVASPATQAILEAPNQSAATLAGIAAMQSNPPTDDAPVPEISSIDHLRACQSFIQAHGMTKYNESFKDGLHVNIVNYTPEQRAQHVAILEALAA